MGGPQDNTPIATVKVESSRPMRVPVALEFDVDRDVANFLHRFPAFPPTRRQGIILSLLHQCDPSDMQFISKVYPLLHRDFLRLLPERAVHCVLLFCTPRDFCTVAQVSKEWLQRINDLALWDQLYQQIGLGSLVGRCYISSDGMRSNARRLRALERWVRGELTCRQFRAHHSGIVSLCVEGSSIVTVGVDKTVRVHSRISGEPIRSFAGLEHTCARAVGRIMASGSADGTLRIWSLHTGKLYQELSGHAKGITTLAMDSKMVISGSSDHTIRIWKL
ncbi:hypothetical protein HKX48_002608, partial [Thoreauomyces humboldtii]